MRIAIVGAGVLGAAAGYELARAGADVVLIDSSEPGRATSAGAGIICPWTSRIDDPAWLTLAAASAEHYPALLDALAEDGEHDVGFRRVGVLSLTSRADADSALARIRDRASASTLAGDIRLVSAAEARAMFPPLGHDGPAVHIGGGGRLDGRRLREALCRAAARHGATILESTASITAEPGGVRVDADGEAVEADRVIVAVGAWAPGVLSPAGVDVHVRPQRGQIVHLGLAGTDTARWPVVLPMTGHYLLAFDDSRVVVGATREDGTGFDDRVTAAGLAEVLNQALAVAPGLADATHLETRVGLRPAGPDARPLLGTVGTAPGLIVANGLGATGLTMGPYVGLLAARLALGIDPGLDLSAYDPVRGAPS